MVTTLIQDGPLLFKLSGKKTELLEAKKLPVLRALALYVVHSTRGACGYAGQIASRGHHEVLQRLWFYSFRHLIERCSHYDGLLVGSACGLRGRSGLDSTGRLSGVLRTRAIGDVVGSTLWTLRDLGKDPRFYESCLRTFNTAELVTTPPRLTGEALAKVFREHHEVPVSMPITMATPSAPQTSPVSAWEGQRE